MRKKIIALTFPGDNHLKVGLEPSILYVLPDGDNIEIHRGNKNFDDSQVELYLCSLYIAGVKEFKEWAEKHERRKIIVGGYHPTMFPEEFLPFAEKIIMGPCDDLEATLSQKEVLFERSYYDESKSGKNRFIPGKILKTLTPVTGWIRKFGEADIIIEKPSGKSEIIKDRILPGILTFRNTPRYDLYNIKNNQQIIPDKKPDDLVSSINTSYGCPYNCDFCCTPVMFGKQMIDKPLELIEREVEILKHRFNKADDGKKKKFLFIRDENFTLQKNYKEKLKIIARTGAKLYLFASANTLSEKVVKTLANNNVYMICMGLEDPSTEYRKNTNLIKVMKNLKDKNIYAYLSFIVNPLNIIGTDKGNTFYSLLYKRFQELKPEMVCGNFLMPFPRTPLWDKYYHLISDDDFKDYDSKTPFLIRNKTVHDKMRYFMFEIQWRYYTSDLYNNEIRKFETEDTLHLRFLELKEQFEKLYNKIKSMRP